MHPRPCHTLLPSARFGYGLSLLLAVLALGLLLSGFSAPAANSDFGYINHSDQALVASHQGSRWRFVAPTPANGDSSPTPFALVSVLSLLLPQFSSQVVVFHPVAAHVVRHHPSFWPLLRAPPLA
ncbi:MULTISPECIES: hypothetical protein [unclassified Marinobacter]|uniref:hypothetical protein n=1 Tax=unclassified Marinobacter TaxID=83889 RepID=UPI002010A64A|nr:MULTISPECIES: hypothetical protein [unclassified Marinobacter]MCL1477202.1 hypothetical protein [Marinobacter sp.]MCL1480679.1 hypothetical protein [Marinobacter sp.]MCL1484904.1 hypothetical protein [Marinobacter sp.]UQG56438.1 hypothetical protein MIH16_01805 [Marinobacter sp. M4C]UQG65242.1 hypothetical protein MIH17_01805 [Marinobacter sp. M2C]